MRVLKHKLLLLFLNQNICYRYSKESPHWDGSFEHPKQMFELNERKKHINNFTLQSFLNQEAWLTNFSTEINRHLMVFVTYVAIIT